MKMEQYSEVRKEEGCIGGISDNLRGVIEQEDELCESCDGHCEVKATASNSLLTSPILSDDCTVCIL